MYTFGFKLLQQDKKTRARVGEIRTGHGVIKTPAFVPVGTQATVKSLTPEELESLGVELFFVNTYHVYLRPGVEVIQKFGGLHKFMNWNLPLITDSGGFQVFSLRLGKYNSGETLFEDAQQPKVVNLRHTHSVLNEDLPPRVDKYVKAWLGKIFNASKNALPRTSLVKISDDGVEFQSHWDGSRHVFTPEKSIELQHQLGADLIVAFDECPPYPTTHEYAKKALERTHKWAKRSWDTHKKLWKNRHSGKRVRQQAGSASRIRRNGSWASQDDWESYQALYGVVQGSVFEDLRKESADFISSLDFDGIAIGGVAVGESKEEMRQVLDWVIPRLTDNKPRHLLGVGEIDDIFDIIERGVDTFDCVQPTRLGRMGHLLISNIKNSFDFAQDKQISNISVRQGLRLSSAECPQGRHIKNQEFTLDITKKVFAEDTKPIDTKCACYTCQNFSRAYLHHLFRVRELLAYRLSTIHNIHFVTSLVNEIRKNIVNGTFLQFKREFLRI